MPKFLKFGKSKPVDNGQKFPYSIKIKDGVFEYGVKKIKMTKAEFKRFWKFMPKKKELKGKEFEEIDTVKHLVVPAAIYGQNFIEKNLIKKSGLAEAESNVKKKFSYFKITEAHIKELVIDKSGENYVASLKVQGVCID